MGGTPHSDGKNPRLIVSALRTLLLSGWRRIKTKKRNQTIL
jgi:hypothetical protein